MKKILILYSGGLDSFIMYHYAKKIYPGAVINCVWFDIGQSYNKKERDALPNFVDVRKIDWLKINEKLYGKSKNDSGNIFIPGRNGVFTILGASIYLPDEIWLGALRGEIHDTATDKNLSFQKKINDLLEYMFIPFNKQPKLIFPLVSGGFGKLESVKWALENGITKEQLHNTSSCLNSEEGNCGRCVVCVRRWGIFGQLGIPEKYNIDPLQNKEALIYMLGLLTNKKHYDIYRQNEVIPYLKTIYKTNQKNIVSKIKKTLQEVK